MDRSTQYLLEVAAAMPVGDFGFRPAAGTRTFAEQLDHIAATTLGFAGLVGSGTPPPAPGGTRAPQQVIADLRAAMAFGATAIAELTADTARDSVPWGGRLYDDTPRLSLAGVVRVMHDHVSHHRGQLVVYLRLRGIAPPLYVD